MEFLTVVSLLTFTFGTYAFGSTLLLTVRSLVDRETPDEFQGNRTAALITLSLLCVCFVWFVAQTLFVLARHHPGLDEGWLNVSRLVLAYFFPPMIMLTTYVDVSSRCARVPCETSRTGAPPLFHVAWRAAIVAVAIPCVAIPAYTLLAVFEVVEQPGWLGRMIGYGIAGAFTLTAVYCTLLMSLGRGTRETREERAGRRWMIALYAAVIVFCVLISFSIGDSTWGEVLSFIGGSIPLMFIFVSLYHEARFQFVDLFLKGGLFLILTTALLSTYFAFVFPLLGGFEPPRIRRWIFALGILPLALSLPWVYRKLSQWIDTRWLGRRFTTVDAIKSFLSELGHAAGEKELCEKARHGLSTMFQAPVRVNLGLGEVSGDDFDCVLEVPVSSEGRPVGALLMGRRANHLPYFSQDATLLDSLSGVFSNLLENIRLQERRHEQDRRERALSLEASRSELKALRAQINPHFLFNALNAIAGLIHKDPLRADQTVEQLSEIFRYTLRGSESEWATLEQELDFVSAYLEVEKARFSRLRVRIEAEDAVRQTRVPTMLVHTLVENAVKHGITRMRGPALIEVEARRDAERLVVEVRDNGPGPSSDEPPRPGRAGVGGYGLRNVRERLAGHFGDGARVKIARDDERGLTVASLVMPLVPLRPSADGAA